MAGYFEILKYKFFCQKAGSVLMKKYISYCPEKGVKFRGGCTMLKVPQRRYVPDWIFTFTPTSFTILFLLHILIKARGKVATGFKKKKQNLKNGKLATRTFFVADFPLPLFLEPLLIFVKLTNLSYPINCFHQILKFPFISSQTNSYKSSKIFLFYTRQWSKWTLSWLRFEIDWT